MKQSVELMERRKRTIRYNRAIGELGALMGITNFILMDLSDDVEERDVVWIENALQIEKTAQNNGGEE